MSRTGGRPRQRTPSGRRKMGIPASVGPGTGPSQAGRRAAAVEWGMAARRGPRVHLDVALPPPGPRRVAVIASLVLGAMVALLLPVVLAVLVVETMRGR